MVTPTAIARLTAFLEDALAERAVCHAVLLDVLLNEALLRNGTVSSAEADAEEDDELEQGALR